jgi:hypothetical protein
MVKDFRSRRKAEKNRREEILIQEKKKWLCSIDPAEEKGLG